MEGQCGLPVVAGFGMRAPWLAAAGCPSTAATPTTIPTSDVLTVDRMHVSAPERSP